LRKAQALNATWNIGGHGFVDDAPTLKAEVEEYRKALTYVIGEAKRLHDAGVACTAPAQEGARVDPKMCPAVEQANWGPPHRPEYLLESGELPRLCTAAGLVVEAARETVGPQGPALAAVRARRGARAFSLGTTARDE